MYSQKLLKILNLPVSIFWILKLFFKRQVVVFLYYRYRILILCKESLRDIHIYNRRIKLPVIFSVAPCIYWRDRWILIECDTNLIELNAIKKASCFYSRSNIRKFINYLEGLDAGEIKEIAIRQIYYLTMFRVRAGMLRNKGAFKEVSLKKLIALLSIAGYRGLEAYPCRIDRKSFVHNYYIYEHTLRSFEREYQSNLSNQDLRKLPLFEHNQKFSSNPNSKIIEKLKDYVKNLSCSDILCLLLEGSLLNSEFIEGWSDIDLWAIITNDAVEDEQRLYSLIKMFKGIENFIDTELGLQRGFKSHPYIRYLTESEISLFFTLFPEEARGIQRGYMVLKGEAPYVCIEDLNRKRLLSKFICNFYRASSFPDYLHLSILKNMPRMYGLIKDNDETTQGLNESLVSLFADIGDPNLSVLFNDILYVRNKWKSVKPSRYIYKILPAVNRAISALYRTGILNADAIR